LLRKLQERDANGTTPTEYLEFVALCKRFSSGSQPQSSSAPGPSSSSSRQLYDYKAADKMDLSTIQVATIDRRSSGSGSRYSSRSSSIDRSHCYRCGATDYYVSVCLVQPQPQAASSTSQPTPPARPTLASITASLMGRKQWGSRVIQKTESEEEEESEKESDSGDESDGSSGFMGYRRSGRAC